MTVAKVSSNTSQVKKVEDELAAYLVFSREADSNGNKKDQRTDGKYQFRIKEHNLQKGQRFPRRE